MGNGMLGMRTLNRLLRKEVIPHPLNPPIQTRDLAQHSRQVLQHQPARRTRMLRRELGQIMSDTASNIHNQDTISIRLRSLHQSVIHGEEIGIHPRRSALTVTAHVVVELRAHGRVRLHVSEHVEVGGVGVLVGAVGGGVGFAVGG